MSHPVSTPDEQYPSPAPYSLPPVYLPDPAGPPGYPAEPPSDARPAEYQYGAQMSGPPMYGVPMSGPPMMGPPMSGPPMMAPPMSGPAMMGPPTTAMPYLAPPPSPAGGGNRVATIALSVVSALLLIVAIVMTVLYVRKSGDLTTANTAHSAAISERDRKIRQLNNDVQAKTDELDRSRQDLTGSQNQTAELKKQKDTIRQCLVLLGEANDAQQKGDTATAKAKDNEATPICDQAFRYLS